MRTVLTYGTFDLFHIGHVRLLERARSHGDRLLVGVSSDNFNAIKGKRSVISFEHRAETVRAMRCVDHVFAENTWDQKADDIVDLKADVLVMGGDWEGKFDHLKHLCEVAYLPRTEGISTTELKAALSTFRADKIVELQRGLTALGDIIRQLEG